MMISKITKKDINKLFWRSMCVNASFNYERHMSQGIQYALSPALTKLYDDKKDLSKALVRHSEFFNSTPALCPFILGVTLALEEKNAEDTLRPLAGGIACSLALAGNSFAPIIFLLLFNIPHLLVRYFGLKFGYNSGMKALVKFEELGLTEKIFSAASILGLLVIGGMVASMVSVNLALTIGSGDSAVAINDIINGIMPKMLSLLTTYLIYVLIKKGIKVNYLLIGIVIVSILGALIGIF